MLLFFCLFSLLNTVVYGQTRQLRGTVTDESSDPLTGVSILLKGTQILGQVLMLMQLLL